MGTQAVRTADRGVRRDEVDGALRDAVVVGNAIRAQLASPERPEEDGSRQARGQDDRCESRHAGDAEDGRRDQERRDRCGVVELDRGLGRNLREQVGGELGQGREDEERRSEEDAHEGQRELEEVGEVTSLGDGPEKGERVGEGGLDDPARRASDGVVALVERRRGALTEVGDDDAEVKRAERDPAERHDRARHALSTREHVPDPQARNDERQLLFRQNGEGKERQGGEQPPLVEVPDRKGEQRAGECDRMELVQWKPLHRRVEEVDEGEERAEARRTKVLACEPEDRQRAESNHRRLDDEEHRRAGPQPPGQRERHQDRVDVRPEPVDLLPVQLRHVERPAVGGRPDRLHHVSEVEATRLEGSVLLDREAAEPGREDSHPGPDGERDATAGAPARGSRGRRARRRRRGGRAGGAHRGV
jgi:hypothetical protein